MLISILKTYLLLTNPDLENNAIRQFFVFWSEFVSVGKYTDL